MVVRRRCVGKDVGLKVVYVLGGESGISFALAHVSKYVFLSFKRRFLLHQIVRHVMNTAEKGPPWKLDLCSHPYLLQ